MCGPEFIFVCQIALRLCTKSIPNHIYFSAGAEPLRSVTDPSQATQKPDYLSTYILWVFYRRNKERKTFIYIEAEAMWKALWISVAIPQSHFKFSSTQGIKSQIGILSLKQASER